MTKRKILDIPLNRAEGDLEIRVEVEDGQVTDAWSSGTMFRGFENLLRGRGARDGLVITPRICGICCTSHLMAAAKALDAVSGVTPPDNAIRLRNIGLMVEHVQSDVRQSVLMFMVDFANPAYAEHSLFDEAVRRYAPLQGTSCIDVIKETKKVLEIVAIIGGEWPHSTFMVPGGVAFGPSATDLVNCRYQLAFYRQWYEKRVLGCSLERWRAVASAADLDRWLAESTAHRDSELGFFIRFARLAGLEAMGRGHGNFLSYGNFDLPRETAVEAVDGGRMLVPAGFAVGTEVQPFDHLNIAEHVNHSWFKDYDGGRHPFEGETNPSARDGGDGKYSWAKAPRYRDMPAETGPLAEAVIAGDPLFVDLVKERGPNAFSRCLARMTRPATLFPAMDAWLGEISHDREGAFYEPPGKITEGEGCGLAQAARGALGHWVRIRGGRISHYQIITPTAWHASPRDSQGLRGGWEEALIGTPIGDAENPVNAGHVVRSFDPCLVCTVHTTHRGRSLGRARIMV